MKHEVSPARRPESFLRVLGKHQLSSLIGSGVGYAIMIVAVSVLGAGPVLGTVIGAASGAVTNFILNRRFTFKVRDQDAKAQLLRYALVSGASCGWNALGMHLVAVELGMQYIAARLIVGLAVALVWNFPLHRYFVFRRAKP